MADVRTESLSRWSHETDEGLIFANSISMLGLPALAVLKKLASICGGPILELGPYIGGSTVALASGAKHRVISLEIGGPNPGHDSLATPDIVSSLTANLKKAGVEDRVDVIVGHCRSAAVLNEARHKLRGLRAGLIFIDINPATDIALCLYSQLLADRAFVVIDDFTSAIAVEKAAAVKAFVDAAVERGVLEEYGVYGWGTWFGRLTGRGEDLLKLSDLLQIPAVRENGHCWQAFAGNLGQSDDRSDNHSPIVMLEDGVALGPGHSLHDHIRTIGMGRYSHWAGDIWFSTSDNTDPRTNGRRYTIERNGSTYDLAAPVAMPE